MMRRVFAAALVLCLVSLLAAEASLLRMERGGKVSVHEVVQAVNAPGVPHLEQVDFGVIRQLLTVHPTKQVCPRILRKLNRQGKRVQDWYIGLAMDYSAHPRVVKAAKLLYKLAKRIESRFHECEDIWEVKDLPRFRTPMKKRGGKKGKHDKKGKSINKNKKNKFNLPKKIDFTRLPPAVNDTLPPPINGTTNITLNANAPAAPAAPAAADAVPAAAFAEAEAEAEIEAEAEVDAEAEAEVEAEVDAEAEADAEAETEVDAEAEAEAETEVDAEAETEGEADEDLTPIEYDPNEYRIPVPRPYITRVPYSLRHPVMPFLGDRQTTRPASPLLDTLITPPAPFTPPEPAPQPAEVEPEYKPEPPAPVPQDPVPETEVIVFPIPPPTVVEPTLPPIDDVEMEFDPVLPRPNFPDVVPGCQIYDDYGNCLTPPVVPDYPGDVVVPYPGDVVVPYPDPSDC